MTAGYLIDTNHLSRAVTPTSSVRQRITDLRQRGIKVGACVPVLCEIETGIQQVSQPDIYRLNLERLLRQIRVWRDRECSACFRQPSFSGPLARYSGRGLG
jgi:predicted nucleic acid-binding protein